jgi:hypothetical protein
MNATDQPVAMSRWLGAGAPTKCFLPLCWKPFESKCIHGKDGHYYCSAECAKNASKLDLTRVEELRPSAIPITPKQKLLGR